jgi:hypothetical protein
MYGADEILVPMVKTVQEVEYILSEAERKVGVGILIETNAAIEISAQLAQLPLTRIYVGLNDLAIENQDGNIFTPLINGGIEKIRNNVSIPFGLAGLTLPERGFPVPCHLLIKEFVRLSCQFSFLRRSFLADVQDHDLSFVIGRIREEWDKAKKRTQWETITDHERLIQKIFSLGVCDVRLI